MDHLIDHIYIGNAEDARNVVLLRNHGIGVIINLTEVPDPFHDGLDYFQLNQADNIPVSPKTIDLFFEFLNALGVSRPVLIHCTAGISRTAAFTTALLVRRYGMSWEAAMFFVKEKRPCSNPSPILVDSLRLYLKCPSEDTR
ncbi:MAG TPA: dual specificity protein phosphatase [Nitrospiria bacterium]|nr:dual specificity protein phosphatase [Nitrospiria bacterium]